MSVWSEILGIGKRKLRKYGRDIVLFTSIAIDVVGETPTTDELNEIMDMAVLWCLKHGRPNEKRVRKALGVDDDPPDPAVPTG